MSRPDAKNGQSQEESQNRTYEADTAILRCGMGLALGLYPASWTRSAVVKAASKWVAGGSIGMTKYDVAWYLVVSLAQLYYVSAVGLVGPRTSRSECS